MWILAIGSNWDLKNSESYRSVLITAPMLVLFGLVQFVIIFMGG